MSSIAMLLLMAGLGAAPADDATAPKLKVVYYHPTLSEGEKDKLQRTCLAAGQAAAAKTRQEQTDTGEPATPLQAFERGEAIGAALVDGIRACLVDGGYQTIGLTPDETTAYQKLKSPRKQTEWLVELAKSRNFAAPALP